MASHYQCFEAKHDNWKATFKAVNCGIFALALPPLQISLWTLSLKQSKFLTSKQCSLNGFLADHSD